MSEASIIAIVGGAGTIMIAIGTIVYNAGRNNQFQAEIRKLVNGLPVRVAVLESQMHDTGNRIAKHHGEIEQKLERIEDRIDRR